MTRVHFQWNVPRYGHVTCDACLKTGVQEVIQHLITQIKGSFPSGYVSYKNHYVHALLLKMNSIFCLLTSADVWKLDLWDVGLHCAGLYCYIQGTHTHTAVCRRLDLASLVSLKWALTGLISLSLTAGSRYSLLDLDQPLRHLGLADFLRGLLSAVGRDHLVKKRLRIRR